MKFQKHECTAVTSFHYDFMLKHFSLENCHIQYTDTDSFLYEIKHDDIYEFIKDNKNEFDTSDYSLNNAFGIKQHNKKVIGKMKDENSGNIIEEFVGLRSKMYTFKMYHTKSVTKRAKGVKKNILAKKVTFDDYKRCITENCTITNRQCFIQSFHHNVYTIANMKKVLDPFDDKRFIIPNTNHTLAWGHDDINTKYATTTV